ncbi:hypothetical protein V6R21_09725 [Limibacter armeniacum]|uniref:hypothetical protein n=1 Tax=Limibacter armeniacum TaxID=466084 RepID=UPI002FE55399
MKKIFTCLLVFFLLTHLVSAQKVKYSFSEGYENVLTASKYKVLVDKAVEQISERYKIKSVKDGVIRLKDGQGMTEFNLHNLLLICKDEESDQIVLLVEDHFKKLFDTIDAQSKLNPEDFASMQDRLSIRVYNEGIIKSMGNKEMLITKEDMEGTVSLLMFDLPSGFTPVPKKLLELWNQKEDTLFGLAQQNVNKQEVIRDSKKLQAQGDSMEVHIIENDDYCASYVLDLTNNAPELVGEWGSVITIPNKGVAVICTISEETPVEFVNFIKILRPIVAKFYNEHPQPVSKEFYWYYNQTFTKITTFEDENGQVNVIAPIGLSQLMIADQSSDK